MQHKYNFPEHSIITGDFSIDTNYYQNDEILGYCGSLSRRVLNNLALRDPNRYTWLVGDEVDTLTLEQVECDTDFGVSKNYGTRGSIKYSPYNLAKFESAASFLTENYKNCVHHCAYDRIIVSQKMEAAICSTRVVDFSQMLEDRQSLTQVSHHFPIVTELF